MVVDHLERPNGLPAATAPGLAGLKVPAIWADCAQRLIRGEPDRPSLAAIHLA